MDLNKGTNTNGESCCISLLFVMSSKSECKKHMEFSKLNFPYVFCIYFLKTSFSLNEQLKNYKK